MQRPVPRAVRPRLARTAALLLPWLLGSLPAHAQTVPATPPATTVAPVAAMPPAAPPRVAVSRYVVTGNTLLPQERLDAALARHTGQRSLDELKAAAQAVQDLYRDAGFGAVVAFLPEQTPRDGQVTIQVVEGRLARVVVNGGTQFDEANVRAALPSLVVGQTPRVREVDAQIQLANENPARHLDVLLQPGAQAGEVEARVQVTELPVQRFTLGLDNTGSPGTRWRASAGYQHANLFGRDHVLALQLQVAPEDLDSVAVLSANYRVPLYGLGMSIDAYAAYSDVDGGTTATAAGPLQFAGKGRIAGVRASKYLPRLGEIDQRLVLGLDHRDYVNDCSIVGLPAGACGSAGESVSVQPLALEYVVQRAGRFPFGASIGVQHNLQLGGGHSRDANFQAVRPGADPHYTLLRLGLFGGVTVAEGWQLQARLIGQWTDDALVPGEQFGIGGGGSVRGYDEREVTGDRGASGSIELWSPSLLGTSDGPAAPAGGLLRAVVFADGGWVGNRLGTPCRLTRSECSLASVGVGLRYVAGPLQARLDIAQALREGNRTGRHDTRAHVSVSYSF